MAKESLYTPHKAPVFRETFADEQTTRVLGGVPTSVTYSGGAGYFNGSGYVDYYNKQLKGTYSIRIRFSPGYSPINLQYFFDCRNSSGTGYIQVATVGTLVLDSSSGTKYINGVASVNLQGITVYEIIISGISLDSKSGNFQVGSSYIHSAPLIGTVELLEIYDYTLTANEVANLYTNERYNSLQYASGVTEILNIDGKNGVIANKWNTTLTNTAVTPKRTGDIWAMDFNGTTSKLDCGSYNTLVGDKSFITWIKAERISSSSLEYIFNNGSLLIAIDNGTWYVSNGILISSDGSLSAPSAYSSNNAIKRMIPFQLAVTRTSAGVVNIYVNGVLSGSANQSSGTPVAGSTNITLGSSSAGSNSLDGTMSAIRIVDGILTAQEVSQLFSSERRNYGV